MPATCLDGTQNTAAALLHDANTGVSVCMRTCAAVRPAQICTVYTLYAALALVSHVCAGQSHPTLI